MSNPLVFTCKTPILPANKRAQKNGSNGARTHDLSRVRRTLIPAELCFHVYYYSINIKKSKKFIKTFPN